MKPSKIRVLHRDPMWLALDKPAGMPTTPSVGHPTDSLVNRARVIARDATLHHPLSRLDSDVTGVVVFALTRGAADAALHARMAGRYRRTYVALLPAAPVPSQGDWTWPISVDPRDPTRRTTGVGADTKPSHTRYETLATSAGLAVVVFHPITGRTHQIRVHAAAAGVPVLGDLAYGGARRRVMDDGGVVSAARVLLHAWAVEVPEGDVVVSPIPLDMKAAWAAADGDASVWVTDPRRISGMTSLPGVGL